MTDQRRFEQTDRRYDEGGTTQDLGARIAGTAKRPAPNPTGEWIDQVRAEEHIRLRSKWMIICGVVITLFGAALAIVWTTGYDDDMPLGLLLPLQAAGLGGIGLGCMEYLSRPHRRMAQYNLARNELVELAMLDLVSLMSEEMQQRFYKGTAWQLRNQFIADTGTENARPLGQSAEVLRFRAGRQRNNR